jgi:hypothetical protein
MFLEANYSAAASSSVSSSYTFYTGSIYDMTFNILPQGLTGLMYIDGESQGVVAGSGSQELGTGSVLLGNSRIEGGNAFSGSIYSTKIYRNLLPLLKIQVNYPTTRARFNLPFLNTAFTLDSDYQAILNRGTALGYSLPSTVVQKQGSIMVAAMKEYGIWDKLDSLYVFATDGDSDFIKLNWKNPTGTALTIPSGFVQTTNVGLTGPGGLNKIINPTLGPNYTANDACVFVWTPFSTSYSLYGDDFSNQFTIVSNSNTSVIKLHAQNNLAASVNLSGAGYKSISRNSSVIANRTAIVYNNNIGIQTNWTADGITGRYGALFGAGTSGGSTATISVAGFGSSLDSENALNYVTILEYITNIG